MQEIGYLSELSQFNSSVLARAESPSTSYSFEQISADPHETGVNNFAPVPIKDYLWRAATSKDDYRLSCSENVFNRAKINVCKPVHDQESA